MIVILAYLIFGFKHATQIVNDPGHEDFGGSWVGAVLKKEKIQSASLWSVKIMINSYNHIKDSQGYSLV